MYVMAVSVGKSSTRAEKLLTKQSKSLIFLIFGEISGHMCVSPLVPLRDRILVAARVGGDDVIVM